MVRIYVWIRYIIAYREILFKFGPYHYFNYIYYNKLVSEKNYKILYKKYLFYLDFFLKKFNGKYLIKVLFNDQMSDQNKIDLINKKFLNLLNQLNIFEMNVIYNYFKFYGSFELSYFIFNKINERLIDKFDKNNFQAKDLSKTINAAIYLNKAHLFTSLIDQYLKEYSNFYFILNNLLKDKRKINMQILVKGDHKSFNNYIFDKNIYIFGPNFNTNQFTNKINNDDICVYTNTSEYTNINSKKNILYINSFKFNNFLEKIKLKISNFEWINLKNNSDYKKFNIKNKNKIRVQMDSKFLFTNGSPMLVQNIVLDLLAFMPKIFITGIDFYFLVQLLILIIKKMTRIYHQYLNQ